jgi:hypothetical protein
MRSTHPAEFCYVPESFLAVSEHGLDPCEVIRGITYSYSRSAWHHQPSRENGASCAMAASAAAVQRTVFTGRWAGPAHCNPAHLCGSRFTGSPDQRVTVKKNPTHPRPSGLR